MASLSTKLKIELTSEFTYPYGIGEKLVNVPMNKTILSTLANGVGLNQADLVWHDSRELDNAAEDLDVSGALTDPKGSAISMAKVKGLLIHNKNTVAGEYIDVGGDTNALLIFVTGTDKHRIHPKGVLLVWNPSLAGYAVTATTGDILQVDSSGSGADVAYDIVIIGTSA